MKTKELFNKAVEISSMIVDQVEGRHFGNDTPCSEWNLQALVNHMLNEISWVPDCVAGKTVKEVGNKWDGDLMGDNHLKSWQTAAKKAVVAVEKADLNKTVHLSYGDHPAEHYIREVADDLLIHSWDLAQGLLCSLWLEADLLQAVYDNIHPKKEQLVASGLFATPIEPPEDADLQIKLLGLTGRQIPTI